MLMLRFIILILRFNLYFRVYKIYLRAYIAWVYNINSLCLILFHGLKKIIGGRCGALEIVARVLLHAQTAQTDLRRPPTRTWLFEQTSLNSGVRGCRAHGRPPGGGPRQPPPSHTKGSTKTREQYNLDRSMRMSSIKKLCARMSAKEKKTWKLR